MKIHNGKPTASNVRNMRQGDRTEKEFVVNVDGGLMFGWIICDRMTDTYWLKSIYGRTGISYRLWIQVPKRTWQYLHSPDHRIKELGQRSVHTIVNQFAMRAESAARGGYDG